jgi:hypothetical protein
MKKAKKQASSRQPLFDPDVCHFILWYFLTFYGAKRVLDN